jgi:hypothetical protein
VPYEVTKEIGRVEIRRYPSLILATVYGLSDNQAFGLLFDYISGNNQSRRKIPMTAPVISSEKIAMTAPVLSTSGSFSFVLPREFTIETAPEPLDSRVVLEETPERTLAVMRFKGRANDRDVDAKSHDLLSILERARIQTIGEPSLMRYNSPFMPGFLRRNEVAVAVLLSN